VGSDDKQRQQMASSSVVFLLLLLLRADVGSPSLGWSPALAVPPPAAAQTRW